MINVLHGDCCEIMPTLEAESFDAIVTDPPYGLEFMGVAWDTFAKPKGTARTEKDWGDFGSKEHARTARDAGRVAGNKNRAFGEFSHAWASSAYRLLKPGGHLLAFSGTRTYHRMVCAIEDAGFEIRDQVAWIYGSGFPKSHNVSKAIDKMAGAIREVVGSKLGFPGYSLAENGQTNKVYGDLHDPIGECEITAPATPEAEQWAGWGTALKPAWEPIVLARKPLSERTVAANVLKHRCGGLNIDATRVQSNEPLAAHHGTGGGAGHTTGAWSQNYQSGDAGKELNTKGRFPANLVWSVPEDEYQLRLDVTQEQKRELFGWLHANA